MEGPSPQFKEAAKKVNTAPNLSDTTKLKLYALYKQVTVGQNETKRPGMFDMIGRAKWDAWNALGDMAKGDAEKQYICLVNEAVGETAGPSEPSLSESESHGLLINIDNGIMTITFNRPERKNSMIFNTYKTVAQALHAANENAHVKLVVITGNGDYFCSGNDFGNFLNIKDVQTAAKDAKIMLQEHFGAYIDLRKPLIAVVNGPSIGVGVTLLGMCDAVFATERATFKTPFVSLGMTPECCSSYLFPRIMGYARASSLLMFGEKITAKQAEEWGLVTYSYPDNKFKDEAGKRIQEIAELPIESLMHSKELIRGCDRRVLHEVNKTECERMEERWSSEECMAAVVKFFSKKSKPQE